MKVSELLERRRQQWHDLENLCQALERRGSRRLGPAAISQFASLYRAACADLALADAYQLPTETVNYLDHLVGRAHNQLYRSSTFRWRAWGHEMFVTLPGRLVREPCVWLAFTIFWSIFGLSLAFGYSSDSYRQEVLGEALMAELQERFSKPIEHTIDDLSSAGPAFYVMHNVGIGLRCFAGGLLLGIGGLLVTISNAVTLGAEFGFMLTVAERTNFLHFVTAHGPFELTAIVFSSAAGMRLGFSLIATDGLSRMASLRRATTAAIPIMAAAGVLFCLAAVLEGLLSPSAAPYGVKVGAAIVSLVLMFLYLFGLGLAQRA
ncbi:MAG TPA: stage II sporulation protein M [Pirellulales bacterium]|jgi:uncharacterized membrane protein SpoIIM required for sporulation|nr:stage II sporulation protein M [Pirellulales bacterium]